MASPLHSTQLGYEQITGLSSVQSLTVPSGANYAIITAKTKGVRFRADGVNPSAGVGQPLEAGQTLEYDADLSAIKFIEQAASAELNVAYFKVRQ
jgi:hypothetical protein